ncbi:sensor histidine kinase [Nocardioides sp. MH1]|uniref:sensor histidine kinase n=1 Tax=Nocardioides sp. MH1 TaxID=3242490 RepID=UPI003520E01F
MAAPVETLDTEGRAWIGALYAGVWLLFLEAPAAEAVRLAPAPRGFLGLVLVVAFAVAYLVTFLINRATRRAGQQVPVQRAVVAVGLLTGLAALLCVAVGQDGTATFVFLAVASVIHFEWRWAVVLVLAIAGANEVLPHVVHGWTRQPSLTLAVALAAFAMTGVLRVIERNRQLIDAHATNAELAVENERGRFARDLHDILGHSLTVIAMKAELAGKLFDVDPERARTEVADLERLSRDALADVRRAVEGYRELTLPGELARARTALAAAEIEATLPGSADEVPTDLRELFAWTVREGVTNVIRHSGARHCEVVLAADRVEVCDDGPGPTAPSGPGSGLRGLRERAHAAGATVETRRLDPGWALAVVRA